MRKILAVAVLDIRRLWMAVGAFGVAVGILPALAKGVGTKMRPDDIFPFVFGITALVAGGAFGADFAEGKPSFFFARPLSTLTLLMGRIAALAGLLVSACGGFVLSHWLSARQTLAESFVPITAKDLWALGVAWAISLFFSLGISANTRQSSRPGLSFVWVAPLRLVAVLGTTALMFGLFTDIVMRAYDSPTPMKLLFGSYLAAAFLVSCVAIELGRTDRLTITRVMNIGMYLYTTLICVVVVIAWLYILHPGPSAITSVTDALVSTDGRVAFVSARVNRGDAKFRPYFSVDLGSGEVQRLTADRPTGPNNYDGPPWLWQSADGNTKVWCEESPIMFRLLRWVLTRSSTFRYQTSFGESKPFPLPLVLEATKEFEDELVMGGMPVDVLPASNGEVFAVASTTYRDGRAERHLSFMSPSRGQISDSIFSRRIATWAFLPSGRLRVVAVVRMGEGRDLQILDVDPATAKTTVVAAEDAGTSVWARFNRSATKALIISGPIAERTVALVDLEGTPRAPTRTLATGKGINLAAMFLMDGRVAVLVARPPEAELKIFSPEGKALLDLPLGVGGSWLGGEPFTNVVSLSRMLNGAPEVDLVDTTSGKTLRRIPGLRPVASWARPLPPTPADSPGARLFMSYDEKLYILPSLTEEPRLMLPRPPQ